MVNAFEMYPTIVTPFTLKGDIDYASLDKLIALFAGCDCDGVFAVCQSSEMFFLDEEEKLKLADFCIRKCRSLRMKCVVSGHTQDALPEQIAYLRRLETLSPDAIILVSNRLAGADEDDNVLVHRLEQVMHALSPDTRLGIYECPYPYKRLLSKRVIQWIVASRRFDFIKDTCCQLDIIRSRLAWLQGGTALLYNANAATLFDSILSGAAGYSGVMLNLMPEVFQALKQALAGSDIARARRLSDYISLCSVIEYQNYPANAKYCLMRRGIFTFAHCRNGKPALNESQCLETDAMARMHPLILEAPCTDSAEARREA